AGGVPGSLVVATTTAARQLAAGHALAGAVSAEVMTLTEGVMRAMFLSKLKLVCVVALATMIGGAGLTYGVGAEPKKPAPAGVVMEEIEALRLEVEALRKGLQATRKRVEALEAHVQVLDQRAAALSSGAAVGGFGAMQGGFGGIQGLGGGGGLQGGFAG